MNEKVYGYWIKKSGEVIRINSFEHEKYAISFGFYEQPIVKAISAGNIRIIVNEPDIYFSLISVSQKQKESILDLLKKDLFDSFTIDYNGRIHKFNSLIKANLFFNYF